jgi:hypothetical protein
VSWWLVIFGCNSNSSSCSQSVIEFVFVEFDCCKLSAFCSGSTDGTFMEEQLDGP